MKKYKIVIIGGGASGLVSAIFAARTLGGKNILLCEAQQRMGRKLLSTGNGRCNLTNRSITLSDYYTDSPTTLASVLSGFDSSAARDFFRSIGIESFEDSDGRVYPLNEQASSVLDMLRLHVEKLGIVCRTGERVSQIKKDHNSFIVVCNEPVIAERVIIACGGQASPSLGGSSDGVNLLAALGHRFEKPSPALTQIKVRSPYIGALKGNRAQCSISLLRRGKEITKEYGEVLFADNALSGIAVFNISRYAKSGDILSLRLLPDMSCNEIFSVLSRRRSDLSSLTLENYLNGMLNKRIANCVLKSAGLSPLSRSVSTLTDNDLTIICNIICNFNFDVSSLGDWKNAQVTRGGILLSEFGPDMQSKICSGIFACGETLNADGKCGGYNLQWAWSSGFTAGFNAAKRG